MNNRHAPSARLRLPSTDGSLSTYHLTGKPLPIVRPTHPFNRVAFSATHVVADPFMAVEPSDRPALDWLRTIAYRRYLIGLGLGIAEAMDTAQRGMGLDWPGALELVERTLAETRDLPGALIFSGCGTEHLDPAEVHSIADVIAAYLTQVHAIQKLGGRIILMASRALARIAGNPDDYRRVYARVLSEVDKPVILHWLGDMFDPALAGYWGGERFEDRVETVLGVIADHAAKVDGIKISLLDDAKEVAMRRRLPAGVKMYSGDDFNYPELIAGDAHGYSHALLGIFDCIAPAASAALAALAQGDRVRYDTLMAPTVPLSRLIFRAPTRFYKTGVVFLAYLNGHQDHPVMVGGQQAMRPLPYFCEIFKLADRAGLLANPTDATARMQRFLAFYGV
ncbi:MAG: dihydrodipicolinate synthase family protein [Acetobacteraceae bacterium]